MRREPLESPDILDFRATVVVCVSALVLSVLSFQGRNMDVLVMLPEAVTHEPWRLLTSCLLHGDWLHLVFNVYWVYRLGSIIEPTFGLPKTIGIYVLIGFLASVGQWAFSGGSIGLSGIVYGMFGLLWVLHRFQPNYRPVLNEGTSTLFIAWFFICIIGTEMGVMNIANVAHGVGALVGFLLGLAVVPTGFGLWRARSLLVTVSLVLGLAATVGRPYVNFSEAHLYELNVKAIAALQADEFQEALEILERAVALDDENITAWHNLSVARGRLGLNRASNEAFARAEKLRAEAAEAQRASSERRGLFDF